MWIASEHTAFGRHTKQFVALHDQEIAVITVGVGDLRVYLLAALSSGARIRTIGCTDMSHLISSWPLCF